MESIVEYHDKAGIFGYKNKTTLHARFLTDLTLDEAILYEGEGTKQDIVRC